MGLWRDIAGSILNTAIDVEVSLKQGWEDKRKRWNVFLSLGYLK
jgi:hypothetical protein